MDWVRVKGRCVKSINYLPNKGTTTGVRWERNLIGAGIVTRLHRL
jgi:hypothetical protein